MTKIKSTYAHNFIGQTQAGTRSLRQKWLKVRVNRRVSPFALPDNASAFDASALYASNSDASNSDASNSDASTFDASALKATT